MQTARGFGTGKGRAAVGPAVLIKFTPELLAAVDAAAAEAGLNRSEWVRQALAVAVGLRDKQS